MNALIPFLPAFRSVTAKTIATSAFFPVVMNCLTPLTIHSLPASSARVRIAAASEPACGSLRQKQPRSSPRASCGSHQLFWFSLPKLRIGPHTTEFWTLTIVAHDASPAAISSSMSASETWSSPAPPQRSGTQTPKRPSGPISFNASRGKAAVRSHSAARGVSRARANRRTVSRIISCSPVSIIGSASIRGRCGPLLEHAHVTAHDRRRDHQRLAEDERGDADRKRVRVFRMVREARGDIAAERSAGESAGKSDQVVARGLLDGLRDLRGRRAARGEGDAGDERRHHRDDHRPDEVDDESERDRANGGALAGARRVLHRRSGRGVWVAHGASSLAYTSSSATAVASPPPMQRLAIPRRPPFFRSAPMSVTMMRAPDAPIG